ncbi:MAG: HDOD domain-containing protein [Deltaproteobacteria bacterium]|nr:HDOD domain-containing protein [Deltaproteobacteria bacterium]
MPTRASKADQTTVVERALKEISHIATLPEITVRIVELVEDPSSTAADLRSLIEHDPALCARVLKVVNSSFYGMPGQVASIERAIVLLGLNAVKNIAISASLTKMFKTGNICPGFAAKDLWVHSAGVAAAAKLIAAELGMAMTDQAFLAGLIHDLGVMVELQYDRNRIIDVIDRVDPDTAGNPTGNMIEAELAIYGATHQQFGEGLCRKWHFPPTLAEVCGHHHEPTACDDAARTIVCLVHAGDRLAALQKIGFRLDINDTNIDPAALEHLALSETNIANVVQELHEATNEVIGLLT